MSADNRIFGQRPELHKSEGPTITNESFCNLEINNDLLVTLLEKSGLTAEQIKNIQIKFKNGLIADRDLDEAISGGMIVPGKDNVHKITIYPIVQVNDDNNERIMAVFKKEVIADILLHELFHFIQLEGDEPVESNNLLTYEEYEDNTSEQQAFLFAKEHLDDGLNIIGSVSLKNSLLPELLPVDLASVNQKKLPEEKFMPGQCFQWHDPDPFFPKWSASVLEMVESELESDVSKINDILVNGKQAMFKQLIHPMEFFYVVIQVVNALMRNGRRDEAWEIKDTFIRPL